ncbi:hypothetical protein EV383_5217 [Pseudonocardia sediminis]|uniref:Uncharacterized protein n=1 Tax=Pseudonocardia sediminis TaxID=1397368 RepID=A0A4Q7V3U2_PSEST|nr:hypothetical protein [Pseudonocardia sediminis]RZT88278.1 hypothetical protein EV383_5217 [Pseudonocardia sediminis]
MSFLGELFPRPKVHDDADASADGQRFRIGEIDLDSGVVQLRPARPAEQADDEPAAER